MNCMTKVNMHPKFHSGYGVPPDGKSIMHRGAEGEGWQPEVFVCKCKRIMQKLFRCTRTIFLFRAVFIFPLFILYFFGLMWNNWVVSFEEALSWQREKCNQFYYAAPVPVQVALKPSCTIGQIRRRARMQDAVHVDANRDSFWLAQPGVSC